jgi:hypothetical protein
MAAGKERRGEPEGRVALLPEDVTRGSATTRLNNPIPHPAFGGAGPDGSGLLGLADRLAVLDGPLRIDSPPDGATLIEADSPLATSQKVVR